MKRTIDRMVFYFRMHNNQLTLGEIMASGEPWIHEFNAQKAYARRWGIAFILQRGKIPSENVYLMVERKGQIDLAV